MCVVHDHSPAEWGLIRELRKTEALLKNDVFEALAAELMEYLQVTWGLKGSESLKSVVEELSRDGEFTRDDLIKAIERLAQVMGPEFRAVIAEGFPTFVETMYARGFDIAPPFTPFNQQVLDWLDDHHMYWIGDHFELQVREKIERAGEEILNEGLGRFRAGQKMQEAFQGEFDKSNSYWEGLSNHVTTRSREFARIDAYLAAEVERYRIVTIDDFRRSDVCEILEGMVFEVSAAAAQRERLISARNPEDVKEIAPWRTAKEIEGKTPEELVGMGVMAPPFHFNCRTRTVADL